MRVCALVFLIACESGPSLPIGDEELALPARAEVLPNAVRIDGSVVLIEQRAADRRECRALVADGCPEDDRARCVRESRARHGRWTIVYVQIHHPDPSRVEVSGAACDAERLVIAHVSTDDEAGGERGERLLREIFGGLPE